MEGVGGRPQGKDRQGSEGGPLRHTGATTRRAEKGELHILGLNTGLVQNAVEKVGFVPLCTMGRDDGSFGYTMEFIVPAGSPIKKLEDVKGRKVTFSRLDSNSGCKAPLVLLIEKYNLLPERDYDYGFSPSHEDSIKRIATKEFEIAPVASDILAGMIKGKKSIRQLLFRSTSPSGSRPRLLATPTSGPRASRRNPRDAAEIQMEGDWSGERLRSGRTTKFVAVNYKDDWADTRRIDQSNRRKTQGKHPKERGELNGVGEAR